MSKRLTKLFNNVYVPKTETGIIKFDNLAEITQKLGPLEDIEENRKCDLEKVCLASINGFYYLDHNKNICEVHCCLVDFEDCTFRNDDGSYICDFNNYSKTWSLKKEDLE